MPFAKLAQKVFKLIHPNGFHKRIAVKLFELPNGLKETFFIDHDKDSVQVLCITKDASPDVVLVQQFRAGPEEVQLELPGGGIEPGEEPLHAGVRELLEETGYVGDATYMGSLPYSPYSSGRRHCVLVINAKQVDTQHLDPNEFVTVLKMPLRDFRNKMKSGSIRGFDLGYMGLDYIGKL
jgi:8-oxo-dGTP pyrophosphatase MutT (NUDIX family)